MNKREKEYGILAIVAIIIMIGAFCLGRYIRTSEQIEYAKQTDEGKVKLAEALSQGVESITKNCAVNLDSITTNGTTETNFNIKCPK